MVANTKVKVKAQGSAKDTMTSTGDETPGGDLDVKGQGDTVVQKMRNKAATGDGVDDSEQNHRVRHHVKKVSVSPRVELMLNNDLFKKYLQKHGDILEKLYKRQGRTPSGMKKALSNIDLSKIDLEEEFGNDMVRDENHNSSFHEPSLSNSENLDKESLAHVKSQNPAEVRCTRTKQRSFSLIGKDDPNIKGIEEVLQRHRKNFKDRKSVSDSRKKEGENGSRSKFSVPSFAEFKRMRREKLLKGQEFVKSVMNNKENLPFAFHNDDEYKSDIKGNNSPRNRGRQSCPDISGVGCIKSETDYAQNVKLALKSVSDKIEYNVRKSEATEGKRRGKSRSAKTDSENVELRASIESTNSQKSDTNDESVEHTHCDKSKASRSEKLHSENSDFEGSMKSIEVKPKTSSKVFHRSKSFNEITPQCLHGSSPPRKSRSSRNRKCRHSLSLTQLEGTSGDQLPADASDPLEMSTDGTNVYVTMKISSAEPPSVPRMFSSLSASESENEEFKSRGNGENCNSQSNVPSESDLIFSEEKQKYMLSDRRNSDSGESMRSSSSGDTRTSGEIHSNGNTKIRSSAIVRLSEMQKSCEESAKLAGITLENSANKSDSAFDSRTHRVVLRASRKRKLPSRPVSKRQEKSQSNSSSPLELQSGSSTPPTPSTVHLRKPPKPLMKSQSDDNFCKHLPHDLSSPGYFSFPNSPTVSGGSVFTFPSPTGSPNNSQNDLYTQTGMEGRANNSSSLEAKVGTITLMKFLIGK